MQTAIQPIRDGTDLRENVQNALGNLKVRCLKLRLPIAICRADFARVLLMVNNCYLGSMWCGSKVKYKTMFKATGITT